ncbi:MAG: monovalent cation/H(+) antiporter subunit G [Hyphomicrobiaceae bacterium]|nr:monovalent cation/H(+) antiporter subunit G [Hyphomicrobiaceae bacterium]MCC0008828.1 monovalent cation/H(+) antiporter subunit G [Hyphomicrobiaceae bacterium]
MEPIVNAASWLLILLGSFFIVVGAIGIVRMPDVFARMHAASVVDTTGLGFLVVGLMLQSDSILVALKLFFILLLFFYVSPVVSHALAQAALSANIEPRLADDRRNDGAHASTPDGGKSKSPEKP